MLGVLDLGDGVVETTAAIAERVRGGSSTWRPSVWSSRPDCGMKYLPRDTAFGKLRAMVDGVRVVRAEL